MVVMFTISEKDDWRRMTGRGEEVIVVVARSPNKNEFFFLKYLDSY